MQTQVTYKEIYDRLLLGRSVKVRFSDRKSADSLRVQLSRWNQQFVAVSVTDKSLCMEWQEESGLAIYTLKSREPTLFEIVEDEQTGPNDSLSDTLASDSYQLRAGVDSLPTENAAASNQQDAGTEEQSKHD